MKIYTAGLPDFIIIGAQKSGTSSLHNVLGHHPSVFIPAREIFFFDVDDIEQHPDFFVRTRGGWTYHDFDEDFERYQEWYRGLFRDARPGQLVGEDSTTYIASRIAPSRIARLLPSVRLVAMLRDPVSRAYSHYWHNVSRGRATMSFEDTLRHRPGNLISRGCYADQIERYLAHFEASRLKVVLFEEFVADAQRVTDEVCAFLELPSSVDISTVDMHRNAATAPLTLRGRLIVNRLLGPVVGRSYRRRLPNMPGYDPGSLPSRVETHPMALKVAGVYESLRPRRRYPKMREDTRTFLQKLYRRLNARLSDLLGRDVAEHWSYMRH
jgi:hypothetical protein